MQTPDDYNLVDYPLPIGFSAAELLQEENNALHERVNSLLEKIYKLEYENEVLKEKLRKQALLEDYLR